MTATQTAAQPRNILNSAQLPRFTSLGLLAASMAFSFGVLLVGGITSALAGLLLGTLIYFVTNFALSSAVEGRRKATDRLARNVVTSFFVLALFPLVSVIWGTLSKGLTRFDGEFFSSSMRNIIGAGGGAVHAIWGTLIVTGLATLISVPIGIMSAIFLVEYGTTGKAALLARTIRFFVDVMTGIPSIVAGLFAYTIFSMLMGPGTNNGISGAAALSVLMIPTVVRSTEEMLRLVPNELREASYALGVPKWRYTATVVIPMGLTGIMTGILLASRLGSGTTSAADSYLLTAFAAVFLGSATLRDGEFHVFGTFIGVLIIAVGFNGLAIFGAPTWTQFVFQGAILIFAVGLSSLGRVLSER